MDSSAYPANIRRRAVLVGATALGATLTFAAPALYLRKSASSAEKAILSLLHRPGSSRSVGWKVLRGEPKLLEQGRLVNLLLAKLELDPTVLIGLQPQMLRQRIAERVRRDFADEHTIGVDGWVLSATEAWLCALVAAGGKR